MNQAAVKEFLYKMADDQLVIGHRNSEWTGIGPIIEEDIAFSSMAQDKIGHAWNMYQILNEVLGEADPDTLGFHRNEADFKSCRLLEMPIGGYDFSLARHFFHDYAEQARFEMLKQSSFEPLAKLATRIWGEIKYHIMHADTWMKQLSEGTEESRSRMQTAINEVYPLALGIFEPGDHEADLAADGIFAGEAELQKVWQERIEAKLAQWGFTLPNVSDATVGYGGRKGYHTEDLKPLLEEMAEVTRAQPEASW